jgi:hypothetical protein
VTEALKLPFSFPLVTGGNAYDFSRGLTTVVYARPGGHADLYLLNEKKGKQYALSVFWLSVAENRGQKSSFEVRS